MVFGVLFVIASLAWQWLTEIAYVISVIQIVRLGIDLTVIFVFFIDMSVSWVRKSNLTYKSCLQYIKKYYSTLRPV